jgi:serine/threonine protein kinase
MGRVYLAYTPGGRPVALKVVRPEFGADQDFRERFRREIGAARRVHGLYTAQVLDADPDGMPPWLVTAYVPGPSLQQAVKQHGTMPPESVFQLTAGVAEALGAIHAAGLVHRDLKPSNVLLAPDGPRVIDFGIAQAVDESALTRLGMRVGSPQFMAPEQILGRPVTPAIDVFALGHLAAYALLGRSVFGTGDPAAVFARILRQNPDLSAVPRSLRPLIERCMSKDPAIRPAPAEIVEACRAQQQAPKTVQVVDTWLPPAMAAALHDHAAPPQRARQIPQPPLPLAPPSRPSPAPSPGPQLPPPSRPAVPLSRPSLPPPPPTPPAQLRAPIAQPRAIPQARPAAPASRQAYAYSAPPSAGQPLPRSATAKAAMVVAAIAAVTVVAILITRGSGSGSVGAVTTNSSTPVAPTAPQSPGANPPPPNSTSALDSCLIGTWTGVSEDITNTIDGSPVQFSGLGPNETYRADGTGVVDYGTETVFSATSKGESWTEVVHGSATVHFETRDGNLVTSDIQPSGGWTIYENGVYNNSGRLSLNTAPAPYTCSKTALRIVPSGGSVELVRSSH